MPSGRLVRRSFAVAVFLSALWAGGVFASGPVELISRADPASPPQAVGAAYEASVSTDGRYVAFLSTSPNLVPGQNDGNHGPDVFLWDRAD